MVEDCGCDTPILFSGKPSDSVRSIDLHKAISTSEIALFNISGSKTSLSQILEANTGEEKLPVKVLVFLRSFG